MSTRRQFFRQAAFAGAGLTTLLSSIERAAAIDPPENSGFMDAEHVVILMQENRSFDHVYGALRGVRGFNDPRAVTLPDQNPVWLQTNRAGETYAPFRLDIKNTKITWLGSLPHSWRDQTDARNHGNHDGWLDAKPSGRKECAGMPFTMGHYQREDIPFYYALADAFTICDQNFCSTLTGTTPNRLHLWTGGIRDEQTAASYPYVRNSDVDYGATKKWKTFPERLEEAGVSWRVYQNELSLPTGLNDDGDAWLANFTDNPLEWFDQYHVGYRKTHLEFLEKADVTLPAEIEKLRAKGASERQLAEIHELQQYVTKARAKWTPDAFAKVSAHERSLHEKAFTTNEENPGYRELATLKYRDGDVDREIAVPKTDPLYRFRKDVESGKLPTVSWLVPSERFSDHAGSPWYGSWFLAETLNILTQKPEVWSKTIFILTYDENDGYFDHVPPFVAPEPGNPESGKTSPGIDPALEYLPLAEDLKRHQPRDARGGPVGLGFRVPMVVASPWSRGGYVCSQVFDHTSVIQLLERIASKKSGKEVREANITPWRRTVCGDMTSVFRPSQSGSAAVPYQPRDAFFEQVHHAQFTPMPSGYRKLSADDVAQFRRDPAKTSWVARQEPGVRPSVALPYELAAGGALSADGKSFELVLEARNEFFGKAASGAPFHVYTPGKFRGDVKLRTRAYTVSAGGRVTDSWELEGFDNHAYHLHVCGPNGFLREFAGNATDPRIDLQCVALRNGTLELRLASKANQPLTLEVKDHGYKTGNHTVALRPNATRTLALNPSQSHNWYDFSVTIAGTGQYLRRFAGRVETGKHTFSDPKMGNPVG